MRKSLVVLAALLVSSSAAYATGFLMPEDRRWAPLQLDSHRVTVDIDDQSARTKVVEVFRNQHSGQLEATFVFPLPKNASVSDFKMYVNGKLVTGEIMEAGQARHIYEDIVRRMQDPGLLEYMDSRLMRLRVFPIPPNSTQEVQIAYDQALQADEGLVEYVYPLKTPHGCAKTMNDFTLTVNISSSAGVKNVYSPSHEISVHMNDDKHAVAGLEKSGQALDRDFQLFYEITDREFGASLLSHRSSGKDGYFMLLLSPRIDLAAEDIAPKDVAFVLDASGSMQGDKMDQARKALLFCVNALNEKDAFNVIAFNISVEKFSDSLVGATPDGRRRAADFINRLAPSGGTNINEALKTALQLNRDSTRPYVIVFITDGLPTVGETSIERILDNAGKENVAGVRIFSFGVGYDVNTQLLDRLSEATRACTQYVEPQENIEVKVSSFFKRVGDPVLSSVEIDFGRAQAYDVYPPHPGDLFRGTQIVVCGRYRSDGAATLTVKGRGPHGQLVFEYPLQFEQGTGRGDFVATVWAGRKIAYLLGEIRLHGENKELKDEVMRLSKEFGIVTPYTAYLITESSPIVDAMPMPIRRRLAPPVVLDDQPRDYDMLYSGGPSGDLGAQLPESEARIGKMEAVRLRSMAYTDSHSRIVASTAPSVGKDAVAASEAYRQLVDSTVADRGKLMRSASGKTFVNIDGVWIDDAVKSGQKVFTVQFGSAEYFELYGKAKKLKQAFALGDRIVIAVGDWCLVIGDEQFPAGATADFNEVLEAVSSLN